VNRPRPLDDALDARGIVALFIVELSICRRRIASLVNVIVFFVAAVSMFPLGVSPDPVLLERIGPGVIWVCALLAAQLAMLRFFADDYRSGQTEQLLTSELPLGAVLLIKSLAWWCFTGLPLALLGPLLAVAFSMPTGLAPVWFVALAIGTLAMTLIGMIGASLTLGVRQGAVLCVVITLPLLVPVLIFGSRLIVLANAGQNWLAPLYLLLAITMAMLVVAPIASALAVRLMLD